jgi:hypothetical protein
MKISTTISLAAVSASLTALCAHANDPAADGLRGMRPAVLEADGHALRGAPWEPPAALPTLGAEFGADIIPAPEFTMPNQDNEFFLAEDDLEMRAGGRKPLRFAVPLAADVTMGDGQWLDVPGGRLWRVEIVSHNAHTARLFLSGINLAAGQQMRLSSPGWAESVVGPIEGVGEFGDGTAWAMSTPSPRILVEWFVPSGQKATALPFSGADYYHGYRDIWAGARATEGGVAVGTCHLDPICFPDWSNESNGTVRLIFTGSLCSGQLTATTAADETPYVSTANHCISTQSVANSCQFNFFYRRNTCASSATASAGSNVTGGDLVRTYVGSDCTLLMIRPTLPANVYWVGWTSATTSTNTSSVGVHHPDGSYQRISFGTKNANAFNCGSPTTNWSSLSWNAATQYGVTSTGVTEGGSSGSAIYRVSDKKMYGVLTCGGSFCSSPGADDGYGRWDTAVNLSSTGFATSMAAGPDDALEDNDTCATSRVVAPGTYSSLVVKRLDEDWYALQVPNGGQLSMNMTFTHANGNINVSLQSACGGTVLLNRTGTTNNEVFTYTNASGSDTLLMRVYLAADTRNDYSFTYSVTTPAPANDNCSGATAVGAGTFSFNTVGATNSTPAIPSSCNAGATTTINKDVWFLFTAPCSGTATAATCGTAFDTNVAVYAGGACPSATPVVTCDDNGCGTAGTASWAVTAGSTWYVRVGSPGTGSGAGSLALSCALPPCPPDLNGDGSVDGQDLGSLLSQWGADGSGDLNGDNNIDGLDLGVMLAGWGACN